MKKYIFFAVTALLFACTPKLDRSVMPSPGLAPVINFGSIQNFTLDNGLTVYVVEDHKLPRVSFSLQFDVDPILEGPMAGMSDITGQLIGTGTATRTKDQINESIDFIGASLNTGAGYVGGSSLKKYQNELLEILADVVVNPEFTEEELGKIKTQIISNLAQGKEDPSSIAANLRAVRNFGTSNPYGELATEETIEEVVLGACQGYFKTFYRPNVAYLAIVGDITAEEAKTIAEKNFGNWEMAEVPSVNYELPKAPEQSNVALVNKNGAVQSIVNITWPLDLKPGSEDAIKAGVMNSVLGGGSTARLFMNLRESNGFTYGAYSSISTDPVVGSFNASASVRNIVTDSAIVEFFNEINRIREEEVPADELAGVIQGMSGQFAMALENPATKARFAINIAKYNLPTDYYTTYLQKLSAVTSADVNAMAKKYLKPENANIIVVGAADELEEKLAVFATVTKYDTYGREATDLEPAPEGVTAETVIGNYINAIGGANALKKVKDVDQSLTISIVGAPMQLTGNILQKAPNKYSFIMNMNGAPIQTQICNGEEAIMKSMQGTKMMESEELTKMIESAQLFPELRYAELGYTTTLLGVDGADYKVEIVSPSGSKSFDWYNMESGLRTKSENQDGLQILSDYKTFKGVKFPMITEMSAGPQQLIMKVDELKVNSGISSSKFAVK
ncbi:MAG: zinc protease [Flavobacteriales bacterium]|jgi:zinc protease